MDFLSANFLPLSTYDQSRDRQTDIVPHPVGKGKVDQAGAYLPLLGPECVVPWITTNVCDAWPVRRQTYGYLPSHKASPPIGLYQIMLLGDRGTRVLTICPGWHSTAGRLGFEPRDLVIASSASYGSATDPHTL